MASVIMIGCPAMRATSPVMIGGLTAPYDEASTTPVRPTKFFRNPSGLVMIGMSAGTDRGPPTALMSEKRVERLWVLRSMPLLSSRAIARRPLKVFR